MKNYSVDARLGLVIMGSALFLFLGGKYLSAMSYAIAPVQISYVPLPHKEKQLEHLYAQQINSKFNSSKIELNSADSATLIHSLKIPAYWCARILEYREKLGGFAHMNQLLEIYHFPEGIYERIYSRIEVDSTRVAPLGINTKKSDELGLHPYLSFQEAKILTNYRALHGPFLNLQSIEQVKGVSSETVQRLLAYLAKDFELIHEHPTPISTSD